MHFLKDNRKELKVIFISFILTRVLFILALIVGYYFLPKGDDHYPNIKWVGDIVFQWMDTIFYSEIAQNGYGLEGISFAFAPLFPLLIRIFSPIFLGNYNLTALIIANISFIASIPLLYKFLLKFISKKASMYSILALLVYPTSHYNSIGYTEGLFIFLALVSMTEYQNKNYLTAALFCGLSILTRITGVAILAGYGIDMLIRFIKHKNYSIKSIGQLLKLGLSFLAVTIAIYGLWLLFMYMKTGNALYFLEAQKNWGRTTPNFLVIPFVIDLFIRVFAFPALRTLLEFLVPLIMLTLSLLVYKKVPVFFWFYSAFVIIMPLTTGSTFSLTRLPMLALSAYVFVGLKAEKSKKFRVTWFLISFILFIIFTGSMGQLRGTYI